MKIALISGGSNNIFAVAIISKLKEQGYSISSIIIRDHDSMKAARISAGRLGLGKIAGKILNKLSGKKQGSIRNESFYDRDYIRSLNNNSDMTLQKIITDNNIHSMFVSNINNEKSLKHLRSLNPDVIISVGGGIVRRKLIDIPRLGVLNAHMGLLPEYKGMNVLEWSLFNGDPIGMTIHYIDEGIDTGDVLLKKNIPIDAGDTIGSLRDKSRGIGADALALAISGLEDGSLKPQKQPMDSGKQYFVMHERIKDLINERMNKGS